MKKTKKQKIIVTAALPYINNIPHLGHIVGSHLPADVFARYCRLKGYETLFIGGTDEHGSASEIAAEKLRVNIEKFSDVLYKEHKKIYKWFNISYDNFSRTRTELHYKTTKDFFEKINQNGFISEGKIKVFYSEKEKIFLPDRYVIGECPKCGYSQANGDQCEDCTSIYDSSELLNPKSAITGDKVKLVETHHLFLRLDLLSKDIEKWIISRKNFRKQVSNLALGWIKEGLKKRCITRDLKNGVKVPLKGYEKKVFYVWFDAPIGYISATKEITDKWEGFWKNKNSKIFNFLGKDNIPFHAVFWPGMLIACGKYNLPENIIGLQYLNYEGKKFSKSKKIGIFCDKLTHSEIPSDVWRNYLVEILPETNDSEFKWEEFMERTNSDLIGNFGNFVNRTLSFINKKLNSEIKKPKRLDEQDKKIIKELKQRHKKITNHLEKQEIRESYREFLALSSLGNKYLQENKPWENITNNNLKKAEKTIYICANLVSSLGVLSSVYLPETSKKILNQLNFKKEEINWDDASEFLIKKNHKINNAEKLFEILDKEKRKNIKEKVSIPTDIKDLFIK